MSWGAQNRSKDAKNPSAGRGMSEKPELDRCPVQPYVVWDSMGPRLLVDSPVIYHHAISPFRKA
jgi:hypothetical protein